MEILLNLKRDSDNDYCDDLNISFYDGEDMVVIELEQMDRSISVEKSEFIKMCKAFILWGE